jgi:hypothetical protein
MDENNCQASFWCQGSIFAAAPTRTWASREPGAGSLPGNEPGSCQQAGHAWHARTALLAPALLVAAGPLHHRIKKLPACLFAAPAGLLADLDVCVHHGHALAFVTAALATRDAGFEH